MTERLYYTDPYLIEFDAQVLAVEAANQADARGVVLDRTAFYPASGGQPFDMGVLGAAKVTEVIDRDDGTILHVVHGDVRPGPVRGRIDWERRFDHMQQHTGQHLLSAAFDRLLHVRTASFHLGAGSSTIDLDREVSAAEIERAEREANRIVWEDRPVSIRFAEEDEAARLALRKEPARQGRLRLIEIQDFDLSACGGTHVSRTGAVGSIVVTSSERFRGGSRIEFLCGGRAVGDCRALRDTVAAAIRLVSVQPSELPAAIDRMQAEAKESKRRLKELQARLASHEAAALVARAEPRGTLRVVVDALDGWDASGLKLVAAAVTTHPGCVAVLFACPPPCSVVVARAPGVDVDSAAVLKRITDTFGGKGGGRPELAQGGGAGGDVARMLAFARTLF